VFFSIGANPIGIPDVFYAESLVRNRSYESKTILLRATVF
jgi:hypothetical protein